jgi:aspartyl-tRNA(Asn)/glutamyl-tRNA(Gln) amidotransferase subunit B
MLNCKINTKDKGKVLVWNRKHYSWPDLPKGYQDTISGAYSIPLAESGVFEKIKIRECHLEEDPASWNPETGCIDYNRSGLPLIEIVTEPDFENAEQVESWLKELILTLSYIKAVDKNAGIKADVNISLPELKGERVEIKNINSLRNIKNAIEKEVERQKTDVPKSQETRMFDEAKGITIKMRTKEQTEDYRFITEPDLPVLILENSRVKKLNSSLPETPQEKLKKLIKKYNIEKKSAEILTKKLEIAEFFEEIINKINPKLAVQWTTIELLRVLNYAKKELDEVSIKPEHFIQLLKLVESKKITELKAKEILNKFIPKSFSPAGEAEKHPKISSEDELEDICKFVLKENPNAVRDYKNGKAESLHFLIGKVMEKTNKRADFKTARELLEKLMK